jgi:hypothetical protein
MQSMLELFNSYYVRFTQEIIQLVLVFLYIVAIQFAVSVLLHVVQAHARTRVSVVIASVRVQAEVSFTMVIADQTGNATDAFAGIVQTLGVVSAEGCNMLFPLSSRTKVYATL